MKVIFPKYLFYKNKFYSDYGVLIEKPLLMWIPNPICWKNIRRQKERIFLSRFFFREPSMHIIIASRVFSGELQQTGRSWNGGTGPFIIILQE